MDESEIRTLHAESKPGQWFWRSYDQKELDFVEESDGRFTGFEFKWGGGAARGAKVFLASYPGSTAEVIKPGNVWDFAR